MAIKKAAKKKPAKKKKAAPMPKKVAKKTVAKKQAVKQAKSGPKKTKKVAKKAAAPRKKNKALSARVKGVITFTPMCTTEKKRLGSATTDRGIADHVNEEHEKEFPTHTTDVLIR
jgi:hypothetical protein